MNDTVPAILGLDNNLKWHGVSASYPKTMDTACGQKLVAFRVLWVRSPGVLQLPPHESGATFCYCADEAPYELPDNRKLQELGYMWRRTRRQI